MVCVFLALTVYALAVLSSTARPQAQLCACNKSLYCRRKYDMTWRLLKAKRHSTIGLSQNVN
jgi:hypothetical protein